MDERPIYLIVTPFFPSADCVYGSYCYDFARALMREGTYDVRVFVPGRGADYDYQGVHVYRFPITVLPSAVFPFLFARRNKRAFLAKLEAVGIPLQRVAICHGHTAVFGIYPLAVREKNPQCLTLLHHHDNASFGLNNGRLRHVWPHKVINALLLRRMHEQIDVHVFISRLSEYSFRKFPDTTWSCYEAYRRQGRGLGWFRSVRVKHSIVLHNGIDAKLFHREDAEKKPGFRIGCVANFNEGKSQIDLLRAVARLKETFPAIEVRFLGCGPNREMCRRYAKGHQLNVTFLDTLEHTQLPTFYRDLDLFVLSTYWEGFGCVFTEAWAMGVPFITTTQAGIVDLLPEKEKAFWLIPPRDVETLAERIARFFRERPEQTLLMPIDWDNLLVPFLQELARLRVQHLESVLAGKANPGK